MFRFKRHAQLLAAAAIFSFHVGSVDALETTAREAILLDMHTGTVLFEKNADEITEPASMTKMMGIYMLFQRLHNGSLALDDEFVVSEKAWRKGGSKMFVEVGSRVRVEDLIRGIIVQSGNDAAIVVAEGLAGSEDAFAREMTETARELGMNSSTFKNATGWPAEGHLVSIRDLATLAQATIEHFPEEYKYYAEKTFTYSGIKQSNRNPLLYRSAGADGLKTGHTKSAGFGLTASAERDDRRLILVVNGLDTAKTRAREAQKLLDWGFREFDNLSMFKAGETVAEVNVWLGEQARVPVALDEDLLVTLRRKDIRDMQVKVVYEGPVPAPVAAGQQIASLEVVLPDGDVERYPLKAMSDIPQLGLIGRLGAAVKHLVWGANG